MGKKVDVQLSLFEGPKTEYQHLWEKYSELKETHGKMRRRVFGELDEIKKSLREVQAQNERLSALIGADHE